MRRIALCSFFHVFSPIAAGRTTRVCARRHDSRFALIAWLALPAALILPLCSRASDYLYIGGSPATSVSAPSSYYFRPWLSVSSASRPNVVFRVQNKPYWASFNASTGTLSGKVYPDNAGTYRNIVISASDGLTTGTMRSFDIAVTGSGTGTTGGGTAHPTISGTPPTTATVGATYSFLPSASDPSGLKLTFSVKNAPSWAAFDTTTGRLSGTPGATAVGTVSNILITASDGNASASLPAFSITVSGATTGTGSVTLSWAPPTLNTNGSALTNLAGYLLNYGTSAGALSQTIRVANPAIGSYQIPNLKLGAVYYFDIVAYTNSGTQSPPSNVVSTTIQ